MKNCVKCKKSLPLSSFYEQKAGRDGLRTMCKKCWVAYSLKYCHARKKRALDRYGISVTTIEKLGLKNALFVYDRADRKCETCGEVNNLTIHHKDGRGSNYYKRGLPMNNNPNNLQVLCRRCHGRLSGKEGARMRKEARDEAGCEDSSIFSSRRVHHRFFRILNSHSSNPRYPNND